MFFHWSLSDSKSSQVSSILAILNNDVVWMVSTRPPTSKSSSPFSNPLVTVPNAPITIGIIVTYMFHSFFQFPSKVEVLISLFTFFQFYSVVFLAFFSHQFRPEVFHRSHIKSPHISRTLLSILADFIRIAVWAISIITRTPFCPVFLPGLWGVLNRFQQQSVSPLPLFCTPFLSL